MPAFAGQQETFLNVIGEADAAGGLPQMLCFAVHRSGDFISTRSKDFRITQVALSVGVQQMVRADTGGSGVMFSIDTESGFPDAVLINAAWGLGENVVQGAVDPDEYEVYQAVSGR